MVYVVSGALAFLVLTGVFLSISLPDTIPQISTEPTFFDGSRAYRAAQELAVSYPERHTGSESSQAASGWLRSRLDDLNIPYSLQTFNARLGDEEITLENVVVTLPGETSDALVLTAPRAHRADVELSPIAGATGTAMLLDLIQVFAGRPHDKTLVFISTEGAHYGGVGLSYYLDNRTEGGSVRSIISTHGLGKEGREVLSGGVTGADTSTPGWLVQLTSVVLATADIRLEVPSLPDQVVLHALRLASGEQVAGLTRDIPTLVLYDDRDGTVTPEGLANQGALLERLLLSLDEGSTVPTASPAALVLASGRFLTKRSLSLLGYLMLVPAGVMAFTWLAVIQIKPESWIRYLRNVLSFFLPPAAWLGLAALLAHAGLLPRYPIIAPAAASGATGPSVFPTLVLIVAAVALFVACRHYLGYLRPREPLVMAEMTKLATGLLVLLAGLILLVSHSAFSLLTAITAAWLWPLSSCFYEPKYFGFGRWPQFRTNAWLLLAGLLSPVLIYAFLVFRTPVGWTDGWWYLLIQTVSGAYGIRGPLAAALITAGFLILLGVKRLRLIPVESLEESGSATYEAPPRVRRLGRRPPDAEPRT
ncbi:MAG: hypothetical protein Kow00129_13100 [Thermoleophilia bacterium]